MTLNEMRAYISKQYPGMKWKARVANMRPDQVIAIYNSFKERNKVKPNKKQEEYHQIDMFEYLYSINKGKETHTEINI